VSNTPTETHIADALERVQRTLDVLVAHLGLEDQVRAAVDGGRTGPAPSLLEIERSRSHDRNTDGDSRR
jgi:hypothetical protein